MAVSPGLMAHRGLSDRSDREGLCSTIGNRREIHQDVSGNPLFRSPSRCAPEVARNDLATICEVAAARYLLRSHLALQTRLQFWLPR